MTPSLTGKRLSLRALEPMDIDLLFSWVNMPEESPSTSLTYPLSRRSLELYVEESHRSIFELGTQKFIISSHESDASSVGSIELYDFDPHHRRSAIGIFLSPQMRSRGYATEAVEMLCRYAFADLHLHQVYAEMAEANTMSCKLFEGVGFSRIARLPHWLWYAGDYHSLLMYARCR